MIPFVLIGDNPLKRLRTLLATYALLTLYYLIGIVLNHKS